MYVKDRSNRIVTTVEQKNKLESPTEFKLYLRNLKHRWGRVLYAERPQEIVLWNRSMQFKRRILNGT